LNTIGKKVVRKRRVYGVAKEFNVSNEALIEFLHKHSYKCRNHMALITDEMYEIVCENYKKKETETDNQSDFRKRMQDKRDEEEARRDAIRHEIDEILERSKGETFETVRVLPRAVIDDSKLAEKEKSFKDRLKKKKHVHEKPEKVKEDVQEIVDNKEKKSAEIDDKTEKPKRHLKRLPSIKKKDEEVDIKKDGEAEKGGRFKKKRYKRKKVDSDAVRSIEKGQVITKKKKKRRRKRPSIQIDEKEIEAAIKETMAKMDETSKRKKRKKEKELDEVVSEEGNIIKTTEFIPVAELANLMGVDSSDVIKACLELGLMVSINQRLDRDTILMVADEFEYDVKFYTEYDEDYTDVPEEEDDPDLLESRAPVVTIMGHVDHGKTSLLDYIRESNIIAGESGGITQHIGAYELYIGDKMITFLDTPGHEAFTAMRARGAQITDIVVLVVAADDSVMPQTIEAINHSKAAGVPIVVAINKIDKSNVNIDQIKKQLSEHDVLVEDWGGKVQCSTVSAKTGEGVNHLLENILLEAEVLELKANPNSKARGVLIEVKMDKGKGVVGSVLVQSGTLRVGNVFIAGQFNGRVRAMFNERGHKIKESVPSTPAQVLGFTGMPQAGDSFVVVASEQEAKAIGLKRQQLKREQGFRQIRRLTLDQISKDIAEGMVKELSIIIKADVDGSLEAISDALMALSTDDVAVRIIHKGVGTITESDVLLAEASKAVIIGFLVEPNSQAKEFALKEMIDVRIYKVIYDVVNDIKLALSGLLEPEISEEIIGKIEIRDVFKASRVGRIAGCYVQSGKINRNDLARLVRDDQVVYEGKISSLKRFKDDVKEVSSGFECGLTLDSFKDIQVGDIVEVYKIVETARTL
jgi:translation initiation factor IF-2